MKATIKIAGIIAALFSLNCNSPDKKTQSIVSNALVDSSTVKDTNQVYNTSKDNFSENIYLKIDKVETGKIFTKNKRDVFYRLLIVPEEENIMLITELIAISDEGGKYQLINECD